MVWDKCTPVRHGPHRRSQLGRRGSLIIEAVIAVALLATATYGLTKLASSSAMLSQQSDQRLAATLAAENTIERLRGLPAEKLSSQAGAVAKLVANVSRCDVEVSTESFTASAGDGIHVRVDVSESNNVRVTLHDWRLISEESEESEVVQAPVESAGRDVSASEVDDA